MSFSLCSEDKGRHRGRIAQHTREHLRKAGAFIERVVMIQFLLLFLLLCIPVGDGLVKPEALNKKAIEIINRVRDKLTGEYVDMFTYKDIKSE